VVEDTPTGVTAGVAAGATVWALCPSPAQASALQAAGATRLLGHMGELAALLASG
jgi:beta-phosphoglucomutase-like phosphatase (HAD superfamily)